MRIRLPRPLKGWRVFAGEVGVIVLGVVLALGAQQFAENLQMRSEVREFRRTIDHEIGLNLFAYQVRSRGSACNKKRIDDVVRWVKESPASSLPKAHLGGPVTLMPYRSAWNNRDARVFNALPAKSRLKYAEFYDELDNNYRHIELEENAWSRLARYRLPGPVTLADRRDMAEQLQLAWGLENIWEPDIQVSRKIADELGIKPVRPDNLPPEIDKWLAECRPAFAATAAGG